MSHDANRASLLHKLVAVSDGDERQAVLFANSPVEQIEAVIAEHEQARANIARYGRLGAEWLDSCFESADTPLTFRE